MPTIHPAALAHAYRFIRPDWRRFVKSGSDLATLYENVERKYSPDQPRVPAGVSDGGQWTSEGGGIGLNDPRVMSDASPDPIRTGTQYAQNRRREGFGPVLINGHSWTRRTAARA